MYKTSFEFITKALQIFHAVCPSICVLHSIEVNAHGDCLVRVDTDETYLVKKDDNSVWKCPTDWRERWQIIGRFEVGVELFEPENFKKFKESLES